MDPVAVHIGVDVGQRSDPTAVCAVTIVRQPTGRMIWHDEEYHLLFETCGERCVPETETIYTARFLERLPLGTPYPAVADRLAEIAANLQARLPNLLPSMYVDVTGVGRPVFDLLRAKITGCRTIPVTFTHGHRFERDPETGEIRLGKAHLVSQLQALLQTTRIKLPATDEARALARELETYEIRVDDDAHDRYGAFKTGAHDDLVTALGLAVVDEPRRNSAVGAFG